MEKQPASPTNKAQQGSNPAAQASQWQVDPVCGMDVDTSSSTTVQSERNGKTYYFCSADCRRQFEASPSDYGA